MYSYSSSKSQNLKRRGDENTTGDGLDLKVGDLQQVSTPAKSQIVQGYVHEFLAPTMVRSYII